MSRAAREDGELWIGGAWRPGAGEALVRRDPAHDELAFSGACADDDDVDRAIRAARAAAPAWAGLSLAERVERLEAFRGLLEDAREREALAETLSLETGKPLWEARGEVRAMAAKVPITVAAHRRRRAAETIDLDGARGATRYKPHGVLAVFGPFNLPGHLPNGHIVPALLAGNTVVWKPSEKTPAVGAHIAGLWERAGLPAGALNLLQGAGATGRALVEHPGHDGVLFTGSLPTGLAIRRALAERPEKIVALEMGGNNPIVAWDTNETAAAAHLILTSAFATTGQRCTCARRLVLPEGRTGDALLERVVTGAKAIRIGAPRADPAPFMGPLIDAEAAERVVAAERRLVEAGAARLLALERRAAGSAFVSPGIVDVTGVAERPDREVFGPLLQVIRVPDLDAAVAEANDTAFGLAAALLSDRRELFDRFFAHTRAGLIHFNRPTTGASSRLPFGGLGLSGNHRPAGAFAVDFCDAPVASLEAERPALPSDPPPGLPDLAP